MRILAFDISVRSTGWAYISVKDDIRLFGKICIDKSVLFDDTLSILDRASANVIDWLKPDLVVIENAYFLKNIKTLRQLETLRTVVKLNSIKILNKHVLEVLPTKYRSFFNLKGKEEAFSFVKNTLKLKFLEFNDHNDITDALLMCLYAEKASTTPNIIAVPEFNKECLMGMLLGSDSRLPISTRNNRLFINNTLEDLTVFKYKSLGGLTTDTLIYNNTGCVGFHISLKDIVKPVLNDFTFKSLFFVLVDSMYSRGDNYYFTTNKGFSFDFLASFFEKFGISQVWKKYKIDKKLFDTVIIKNIRKAVGRKALRFLQDRIK
jgi:Holliday junction resolvasome RuvABC endonuclease subunit